MLGGEWTGGIEPHTVCRLSLFDGRTVDTWGMSLQEEEPEGPVFVAGLCSQGRRGFACVCVQIDKETAGHSIQSVTLVCSCVPGITKKIGHLWGRGRTKGSCPFSGEEVHCRSPLEVSCDGQREYTMGSPFDSEILYRV